MSYPLKKFAVIGNPIAHSLSPIIHQSFAMQEHINMNISYEKILLENDYDVFCNYVHKFFMDTDANYNIGLNITLPFKEMAYKLASMHNHPSAISKSANTLFLKDGKIHADNTDGFGLVSDINKRSGLINLKGKNILLIGAGGAAKGCISSLVHENPQCIYIANRRLIKAKEIQANISNDNIYCCELLDLEYAIASINASIKFDVIINSTSIGMNIDGHNIFENYNFIHKNLYHADTLAYDMIYNKVSPFSQWAKYNNLKCMDGLGMLIEQAAQSFYIWNKIMPSTDEIYARIRGIIQFNM
jgi:shikimate dehydrogenase